MPLASASLPPPYLGIQRFKILRGLGYLSLARWVPPGENSINQSEDVNSVSLRPVKQNRMAMQGLRAGTLETNGQDGFLPSVLTLQVALPRALLSGKCLGALCNSAIIVIIVITIRG